MDRLGAHDISGWGILQASFNSIPQYSGEMNGKTPFESTGAMRSFSLNRKCIRIWKGTLGGVPGNCNWRSRFPSDWIDLRSAKDLFGSGDVTMSTMLIHYHN